MNDVDQELAELESELRRSIPGEALERLIVLAAFAGARRLLEALDREGRIQPCGQGCGWEGPWSLDTTLWPADRERLLGERYQPPAEQAEREEQARLRPG